MTGSLRELRSHRPDASFVCVAPDARRIAFFSGHEKARGVHVADDGADALRWAAIEEPWKLEELCWSPDGSRLAWVVRSVTIDGIDVRVGWTDAPAGEAPPRTVPGHAFVWTPQSRSLLVAHHAARTLRRVPIAGDEEPELLAPLADDGHPRFPPRICVSNDGKRIAWSCRRIEERLCEVWVLAREGPGATLVTQIPGSQAHVSPFWSPSGATLGISIVHYELDKSAIVAVRDLEADGTILYTSDRVDSPEPPVWAPSGEGIVFQHARADGQSCLVALNPQTRVWAPLAEAGAAAGRPRFLPDGRLVVDGGSAAYLIGASGV